MKKTTRNILFLTSLALSTQALAQPYGWQTDSQPSQPAQPTPTTPTVVLQGPAAALYNAMGGTALWYGNSTNQQRLNQFIRFLPSIQKHGLRPTDYRFNAIYQTLASDPNAFDIQFTTEVLRLLKDVSVGRLKDPRSVSRDNVKFAPRAFNVDARVVNFFNSPNDRSFETLAPQHKMYQDLVELLARLQAINSRGGYAGIKVLPKMFRVGVIDPIVAEMKSILNVYGFNLYVDNNFDEPLKEALKKMQEANLGLPDGIVSPVNKDVLTFFNVDSFTRAQEVELVMEQIRWLPTYLGDRYLFLNSAVQELTLHDPNLETTSPLRLQKTVNGRVDRATPSLQDEVYQVILNPTWTVPESLVAKDKLPAMRKAFLESGVEGVIAYLDKMRFSLLDRATNMAIDPYSIDWATITGVSISPEGLPVQSQTISASNLSFKFVQSTGSDNALGVVKFNLKNPYAIYLHDTNERNLFGKDTQGRYIYNNRLKSSGCVRVEHPIELATYLLQGTEWTLDRILATVPQKGQPSGQLPPTVIPLAGSQRVKVYLLPMTA
ncbi:MAG: L,D-transpeptidase family protein, partial [Bdellovibrionota bacterium]